MLAQCARISTRVKRWGSALGTSGLRRRIGRVLLTRHEVNVVHTRAELPAPLLDRHCLLRIVVNLTSNAKRAMNGVAGLSPCITLGAARVSRIAVAEKREGIAPENLTRIFAHAVTTRVNGNRFGLHSAGAGQRSTSTIEIAIDALGGQR
jgi:C4-dicarboxylate-specific signal transduction histidine kinase